MVQTLEDRGVRRRIRPGSHLIREGRTSGQFFVIERGRAVVTRGGHRLGTLRPGSFAGEMALLNSTTASATVTAVSPMVVRVFDRAEFQALLESSPELRTHIEETAELRRSSATLVAATLPGFVAPTEPSSRPSPSRPSRPSRPKPPARSPRVASSTTATGPARSPRPARPVAPPISARPRRRRARRTALLVASILGVVVLGGGAFVITQRNVTTRLGLHDALQALRSQPPTGSGSGASGSAAASSAASATPSAAAGVQSATAPTTRVGPAPRPAASAGAQSTRAAGTPVVAGGGAPATPFSVPAAGAYSYATTGGESISVFGAHHDFPSQTYAVVKPTGGCAWEEEWQVIAEHTDYDYRCSQSGALLDNGDGSQVSFFGQTDSLTYWCKPAGVILAVGVAPGTVEHSTCASDAGDQMSSTLTYAGIDPVTVGDKVVQAAHVTGSYTMTGRANGWAKAEFWFEPSTGLVLQRTRIVDTQAHAAFGNVEYKENASWHLQSLTPATS